jgi:hypothetical protein
MAATKDRFGETDYIASFENGTDFDYNDYTLVFFNINPVPEPTSYAMFGVGAVGLAALVRRRRTLA